nr:reverse transcriptase domain-containing protein [Tanacetum cinerariifolium]
MKDDYKPAVQSQRRVNPKIHDVIKKEVIKLLDAGMIYPISDSPWVSPIHYVPKKRGMTVVANENNKLILTRLVTGWRVCIDYRKLNDATRKDHFPLPFMDQMLERLAGNEFYCFLDEHRAYWALKHVNFNLKTAGDHRKLQLNELNELRDQACENSVIYKERTKKLHDSKIKNRIFNVGDQVLLFNSRLNIFSGKLKTRWSGPFTITVFFLTVPLSYLNLMIFTRSPWTTKFEDRVKLSDSVKKTSASWEAPHAYPFLSSFYFSNMSFEKGL